MLAEALKRVVVIGAAGKMGSGIALLLIQEMARSEAAAKGLVGSGEYRLVLIDSNAQGLISLRRYLRQNLTKYAEKNINSLRQYYSHNRSLVSNEEIIHAFVEGALDMTFFDEELSSAKDSALVFEAIVEDIAVKTKTLSFLRTESRQLQYYLTNTSSIPISLLNEKCELQNRIVGFHFYNPPAVQKLLEVVFPKNIDPALQQLSLELSKRLHKSVVQSHDVAGFIGNGHFIREVCFACEQARMLVKSHNITLSHAIYIINYVTQNFLLRPMGIFQLIDFVGIDVCQNIAAIMQTYLPDGTLHDAIIDDMVAAGIKGGQHGDGSQKSGCFQYEKHSITGVYSLEETHYVPLPTVTLLGETPPLTWKGLQQAPDSKAQICSYLEGLVQNTSFGATIAKTFLQHSNQVSQKLVETGVAEKLSDVDIVLTQGFYHLYGVTDACGNYAKKST